MKSREKILFLLISGFVVFNGLLIAQEEHKEDPHYEWFDSDQVAVNEDGIYADSNKGMFKLNVVEYDRVNDRYKVLCSCLKRRGLDPVQALAFPQEDTYESFGDSKS